MPRRVFLHIGPPKTGTTYLQSVLRSNQRPLKRAGVLVPGSGPAPHFEAASDLRDRPRRGGRSVPSGAWDRLATEVRKWSGTAVISCEWMAFCDDEQIARAARSFGDAEVHVVLTLRDLGRLVPAVWQEQVKNGKDFTMTQFLDQLSQPHVHHYGQVFWSVHDTRQLVGRWAAQVPADRIHLVTLPSSGAPPDELWRRFGSLLLADPETFDTSQVRANPGLDPADAELMRRVNAELGGRMKKVAHAPLVKHFLNEELIRHRGSGGKIRLPAPALADMAARADEVVAALRAGGYDVVGSLDELSVNTSAGAAFLPEDSSTDDVASAAVTSMAALLLTMQADGAHRRKAWRRGKRGAPRKVKPGRQAKGGRQGKGGGDRSLARRVAGRVRRVAAGTDPVLGPGSPARAVVHVGAPKTGSTYLQAVLWRNREALRAAGVLYPLQRPAEHFHATLDVREMSWGGRVDGPWLGAWDVVAARVEAWEGSVVLSNELLGGANPEQCRRVVDTLAGPSAREVHVVFTARDFARQLPSDWQEQVKHRHDVTLPTFVGDLVELGLEAPAPFGELFWGLHDAEAVLGTWAAVVPVQQLHLVTVPHRRTGQHDLWERFARAAGLDGFELDLEVGPRNESLGVAEAELLRLLTGHLRGRLAPRHYDDLVRGVLAETVLVSPRRAVAASERPTLPPEYADWVRCRSEQLVGAVEAAGYDVVGDLADLLPAPASTGRQPDQLRADDLLPVALDALAGTVRQLADVTDQLAAARAERDYWQRGGLVHRVVRFSDRHPWTKPLRRAYSRARRLRGGGP